MVDREIQRRAARVTDFPITLEGPRAEKSEGARETAKGPIPASKSPPVNLPRSLPGRAGGDAALTETATRPPRGRFLRIDDVAATIGLSRATINRLHRAGNFPAKVRISANGTGWWESEIEAWKATRARVSPPT